MHTMRKSGKRRYKVVDESALCPKAISLHKTWPPVQPHQEHTGDSSPSKTEPYFMCTICNAGKQRYEVGDEPNFAHRPSPCTRLGLQPAHTKSTLETAAHQNMCCHRETPPCNSATAVATVATVQQCDSATVLRQCDSFATVRQLRQYELIGPADCCRRAGATVATVATACDSCDSATVRQ